MPTDDQQPAPMLRGMDPARLLDAVAGPMRKLPVVPGWRVVSIAGEGGMGLVWRGTRVSDGAEGAIKLAAGRDLDVVERIEGEADALRALEHANIVRLLDAGPMEDGGLFLAMEYVHGPVLSHIIPQGGLPEEKGFAIFRNIASAVEHAHSRGILHRDLKPANVLLCTRTKAAEGAGKGGDFFVKVADFGMAKPVHERMQKLSLTQTGLVAGTAEYIPPEAYLQAYVPDKAGDIYALGVIFYELLAGTPPRGAWQPVSKLRRVDVRLDEVLAKAMNAKPEERWKSAGAMLAAVEEILQTPPRYTGAPLVLQATRVADFVWTVVGLSVLFLAICTTMRLDKYVAAAPVDLIGRHSNRAGGFQALFFMLLMFAPVGAWQVVRLWRFRRVPLREALPAAFGARLGTGRTALLVAGASQFFCVVLPVVLLSGIFLDTGTYWLRRDSPPWAEGLCVMPWGGEWTKVQEHAVPLVNPWSVPQWGGRYWLCEFKGPPHLPASARLGRVGFFPLLSPGIMLLSASLVVAALAGMVVSGLHTAVLRRRWAAGATLLALGCAAGTLGAAVWREEATRLERDLHPKREDPYTRAKSNAAISAVLGHYEVESPEQLRPLPPELLGAYAEELYFRGRKNTRREEIPALLEADRAEGIAEGRRHLILRRGYDVRRPSGGRDSGKVEAQLSYVECIDPPEGAGPARLAEVEIQQQGSFHTLAKEQPYRIKRETLERRIIYNAESRTISAGEAAEWHGQFIAALAEKGAAAPLGACFFTKLLQRLDQHAANSPAKQLGYEDRREAALEMLRSLPPMVPLGSVDGAPERIPGGRSRVRFAMREAGTGDAVFFLADLACIGGRWQCVFLDFQT